MLFTDTLKIAKEKIEAGDYDKGFKFVLLSNGRHYAYVFEDGLVFLSSTTIDDVLSEKWETIR